MMQFFEIKRPFYALIKAISLIEAIEIYKQLVIKAEWFGDESKGYNPKEEDFIEIKKEQATLKLAISDMRGPFGCYYGIPSTTDDFEVNEEEYIKTVLNKVDAKENKVILISGEVMDILESTH